MVAAVVSLGSCARVQEACGMVAEADSLRAVGQAFTDSVAIADAVEALYPMRFVYPTDYAHANYYYGRLLREHGNHPAAMEAFLRTVHSRTRDHAIKGRAYCNMGIMAGLATEHELAYNVYKCSAGEFLTAQDTTAYYYALIDMAFEQAKLCNKSKAYEILAIIESQCSNQTILTKLLETKAEACILVHQNDSALYYSTLLWEKGNHEPTGLLIRAQAYDNMGQKDSALLYANMLLESSSFYGDRFNALYIITHNDTTINVEEVLNLTSDRTDIQMEYTEIRALLSQAAQLLLQDLNRKPDLRWLIAIIATIIVIGIGIIVYVRKKKRQHRLISQQIEDEQQNIIALKSQLHLLNEKQEHKQAELQASVEKLCALLLRSDNLHEIGWQDYPAMCEEVNARFNLLIAKLQMKGIVSERELRLCVLTLIGHGRARTAELLNYSPSGIGKLKDMTAKKMGSTGKDLHDFLLKMVLDA